MNTKKLGELGERLARDYLEKNGYKILDRNYSFLIPGSPQQGEIDIIAERDNVISFVEVKTLRLASLTQGEPFRQAQDKPSWQGLRLSSAERPQNNPFSPEDKVNFEKRKRIIKTAEYWLSKNKVPLDSKWQISVIAITINPNTKKAKLKHFEL